ncbi:MAG: hypothetical protein VYE22_00970 [Myxococcota bacterium]|nr:hypothetical protein [Myxococcota bacterium]
MEDDLNCDDITPDDEVYDVFEDDGDGPPKRQPLNPSVDDLGRRYLEDATEAPAQPMKKRTIQSITAYPLADFFRR